MSGPLNILTLNLVFSTLVFWIAAQIYLLPRLGQLSTRTVLVPILLLHSLRLVVDAGHPVDLLAVILGDSVVEALRDSGIRVPQLTC